MNILENMVNMLYDTKTRIFEPEEFQKTYNNFYDKHLTTDDLDKDFENYFDLNNLLDKTRSIAFCIGFRTAAQLWIESMKY